MLASSPSENVKKMMKGFSKDWKKGIYSSDKQKEIFDISNMMLKKRKRSTHFEALINTISAFSKSEKFNTEFSNWSSIFKFMITNSATSRQMKFLAFSKDLFLENTILRNRSLEWKSSNASYSFMLNDSVPLVKFNTSIDLSCFARGDTMIISQTEGVFYPIKGKWRGKLGTVNWNKAGFSIAEVYAELEDYSINMKNSFYTADSVRFYNSMIFDDQAMIGILEDKLIKRNKKEESSLYPKFDSYSKDIVLSELIPDVDFKGGYSLHGNKFVSSGGEDSPASLVFYRNGKKFITLSAERLSLKSDKVVSSNVSMMMMFDGDSIFHPGTSLIYNIDDRRLNLLREGDKTSKAPFVNTYHDLDMSFQQLKWQIDSDEVVFGTIPGNTSSPANFESSNYFSENRFRDLLGIDKQHPLLRLDDFVKKYGQNNSFLIQDFLNLSKFSDEQDIKFLLNMDAQGFIIYDKAKKRVFVKENVNRYIMAKSEKIDHDVINFVSNKPKNNKNAVLNLLNMDLNIYGVDRVFLSSVRDVLAYPSDNEILVKQGRDFSMGGTLIAGQGGRFRIDSEFIDFDYEDFKLYFKEASAEIWVPNNRGELDQKGMLVLEPLQSFLSISNGELLVDTSINKSGIWKEDYPQYPIIRSYDRSKVYYDRAEVFNGVYNRENFFFDLEPFEMDSLDSYTRESLSFKGDFYSADIFPMFPQAINVQDDNVLGFKITLPEESSLYAGKGTFSANNNLSLDNNGLRGSGDFQYLTSNTNSNDYVFFPDSMRTSANTFELQKNNIGYEFPQSSGDSVYENWLPYEDVLTIRKEKKDINIYNAKVVLDGELYLKPEGLTGMGKASVENSELTSDLFYFNLAEFNADTADFKLNRSDNDLVAFESVNLRTSIDLNERLGTFKSNGSNSFVSFPENQYICFIDQLNWYMDDEKLELGASDGGKGSEFVSLHSEQDSLSFFSKSAFYDLNAYIIDAKKVDEILVADAAIYPGNGKVVVLGKAKMQRFEDATLLVNTEDKYHNLFDATIDIKSKNEYAGLASVNFRGRGVQEKVIKFDTLFVLEGQTIAKGIIDRSSDFKFNLQFQFKGDVVLEGLQKEFLYDGHYKVNHECDIIEDAWVQFKDYVGVEELKLPIGELVLDQFGERLYIGPIMSGDKIYPSFLSKIKDNDDIPMMNQMGYLSYNNNRAEFEVKDINDSLTSVFTMTNTGCIMKGDGEFSLGMNLGQVELKNIGKFNYNALSNTFKSSGMLALDFYMSENAMSQLGNELGDDPMADELELDESEFTSSFNRILKDPEYIYEYEMFGEFEKLPEELKKSIYFYDVSFEWNVENSAFMSKNMLGIGNIQDVQVNKLYEGRFELDKGFSGDVMNLYFETDIGEYYFFSYANEKMWSVSSIEEFNLQLLDVKVSQRKLDTKKGEPAYQFNLSSEEDVDNFKKRFFR